MVFWHVGGAVLLFRVLFKDPNVDLRLLAAGAVLPDVIDLLAGRLIGSAENDYGYGYGHTLAFFVLVLLVALWSTRPRTLQRKAAAAAAVGVIMHLLLDWMWVTPQLLLWPIMGWDLPTGMVGDWSGLPDSLIGSTWRIAHEVAGLAYLVWLGHRGGLSDPARRDRLWRTGRIGVSDQ